MKLWVGLAFITFLTGCSSQLGYRFADTFIEWKVDDYVDLSGELESDFSQAVDEFHLWHAQQELPKYRQSLLEIRALVTAETISEEDSERMRQQGWMHWDAIRYQAVPYAKEFLPRLTTEQIAELSDNLQAEFDERLERRAERDAELAELSDAERLADQVDESVDNMREWVGPLRDEQRQMLRDFIANDEKGPSWMDYRQAWLNDFIQLLQSDSSHPDYAAQLEIMFEHPHYWQSEALQAHQVDERRRAAEFVVQMHASLSAKQKQHLLRKIDEYIELLDDLIEHYADA